MSKTFEPYPIRRIRISDEDWKKLRDSKLKSAKTWNNFLKELIKEDGKK